MITYLKTHKELVDYILKEQNIAIYCCGPTIYQNLHKGNYRSLMLLDYIYKLRDLFSLKTRVVVNITDIDDKIFNWFPTKPILDIIKDPIYKEKTEEVLLNFYESLSFLNTSYKKWSFIRVSEELEDLRTTMSSFKNIVSDEKGLRVKDLPFCLWKGGHLIFSNKEQSYPTQGHPSWHLECSHIIKKYLGGYNKILHLGGVDLKVLHHPNEIALLERMPDHNIVDITFAYSGLYSIEGNKMSKSLKNEKYFERTSREEIINYYLSDFNRPLVETSKRLEQISVFCNTIFNNSSSQVNNSLEYSEENRIELVSQSPGMLYRTNVRLFSNLIKLLYPLC